MASTATTIIARGYLTIAEVHDGDPACTYVLLPSVESVTKKLDGTLSATAVSCSVYKVTGASAYELSGDHTLRYHRTPDGATGTLAHATGTSAPIDVLATTEAIEFELSDGTNVLDRVRVPVLSDATDVNNELDRYKYLRAALEQDTTIKGGLILSSLIALGYTDDAGVRHTMAGTNGVWQSDLEGCTIGSWWGGPMVDLFDKNGNRRTDLAPGAYATSLVRMDGSFYFANGNIGGKVGGSAWFGGENGLRIDEHGTLIMGNGVLLDFEDGTQDGIVKTLESMVNFQLGLKRLLQPCDANDEEIDWAEAFKSDGTPNGILAKSLKAKVGLWSTGFISALGKNDSASVGGGGAAYNRLDSWSDYDSTKAGYVLSAALGYDLYQHKADVSALTALTSRVSALESKNYLDALVLSVVGSGNAVTAVTLSADKKTLTVNKGATFLTSITKSMVEAVLTGNITSHTHSQYAAASSLGNYYTKTESNSLFAPVAAYDLRDGCLVKLNVSDKGAAMVTVLIEGNSYQYDLVPVKTILNFYNYPTDNTILNAKAIHFGYDFGNIKVFTYGGNICLWFKQGRTFQSFFVSAFHQAYKGNIVESVTNSVMPTVGVARLVEITPSKGLRTDNYASVLSSVYAPLSHTHTFASLTSKPTTIAGYGITDAYTKGELDTKFLSYLTTSAAQSTYVSALGVSGNYLTWTKNGALNNITVPYATESLRFKSTILNNGDDLDTFRTSGLYHATQTSVCASLLNGPSGRTNGELWFEVRNVGTSGYGSQLLFTRSSTVFEYWVRTFNSSGAFSAWQKFLTDTNYSSILDSRYYTESEVNAKLTNGSVTKVGTVNVGSNIKPIYLAAGVPTACAYSFGNASGNAALNNGTRCTNLNADMLDGAHADDIRKSVMQFKQFAGTSTDGGYDLNTLAPDGGLIANYGGIDYWGNAPQNASYGIALHFPSTNLNLGGQLFADINHNSATDVTRTLWWRASGSVNSQKTWGKWHQIAFTDSNVDSASKLATARTIWGRPFDGTENVTGALTSVTSITMSGVLYMGENNITSGTDYISLSKGSMAQRLLTGGLLVSGTYSDRTKIPSYGAYISGQAVVGSLKIGDVTISYDASNGGLHVSGGGLYSDSYISVKGSNSDTGSGGGAFGLMRSWPAADPGESTNDALGANLGFYLYKNKADLTALTALTSRVTTLEGKEYVTSLGISGNYLTWTKNGVVNNIPVPYAKESSLFSPISMGVVFDANTVGSTQRISYYNTIHSGTTNIPYNSGWQSALLDIGLHANGTSAQLYFTLNHSMYFRPNKTESWRTILDSANTQISDGTITINGTSITPLTQHQNIYSLTIQRNGVTVGTFDPNGADKTINLSDIASAATLSAHTSNSTIHITASERTAWNNKVDKVSGKGLSANDFTDALLSKLNGIEAGANKYVLPTASASVLGGVKIGDNITISNGVISTHAPYVHPTATATTIAAASGKVLSAITVNGLGHVTSVSSKTLAAADIPALPWSKITSGKPTTLAGYGITDAVGLYAEQDIAGWKTFLGGFNVTDKSTTHNFADLPRITMSVQGWCYSKFVHSTDDKMHLLDGAATSFDGMHKTFVAGSFVKYGGTARQLLKADGSVASLDVFQAGDIIASRLSFNNGQNFMEWDAENSAVKVNGNLYATGGLSCLGFSHISATEVAVTSIKVGDAVFTQSGGEIYVTIGSTRYKLTKTTA